MQATYRDSKIAGLVYGHGGEVAWLKKQKNVNYDFLNNDTDIEKDFLKESIPYDELKEFEKTIPGKSLWRFIAMDRRWGYQFCKGAVRIEYLNKKRVNNDNILKIAGGYIKFFKKILSEFQPDVVLFRIGMHSMKAAILEQLCKNMNILHICPVGTTVQNYISITENKYATFPRINDMYKKIMDCQMDCDISPGEKCYDEMMAALDDSKKSYYYDQGSNYFQINKSNKLVVMPFYFLKSVASAILQWVRLKRIERKEWHRQKLDGEEVSKVSTHTLKHLTYSIYCRIYKVLQDKYLSTESFFDACDFNEKYLYFPLQQCPEYNILVRGNMWINQLHLIEVLAKSIPFNWKIYVKEHPSMVGRSRVRPFSFYKEIKSYSNVKFVNCMIDGHKLMSNSEFVVTVGGTTGWESVLFHGKPVIHFIDTVYGVAQLSKRVSDIVNLSKDISDEYERINKISAEERKKRLVCLLNALILNSFWVDKPMVCTAENTNPPSDQDLQICGKVLADEIIKYIKL